MFSLRDALHRARETGDAEGRICLEAVEFAPNDFGWLEDFRTLGLAEHAARHGRDNDEATLLAKFRQSQPLLIEPDHAVFFHFLPYQEKLRAAYVDARGLASLRSGAG
jgi:hypothetical protein